MSWLEQSDFEETKYEDKHDACALRLEQKYQTRDKSKGANSTDIKLIAYAKISNAPVVTLEARQSPKPDLKHKWKIPLICKEEAVECIDLYELIRDLGIRI